MYNILVNGRSIDWLQGLDTRLQDGDEVVFIPPPLVDTGVPDAEVATSIAYSDFTQHHRVFAYRDFAIVDTLYNSLGVSKSITF